MIRPQFARQGSLWLILAVALMLLAACGDDKETDAPFVAQRADPPRQASPVAPGSPLNLFTQQTGPYRVSYAALRQSGIVSDPAQLNTLGLTNLGQPVPVWVDGAGADAGLIFLAQAVVSDYTRQNVYRLQADPAPLRPSPLAGPLSAAPVALTQFTARLHLEENIRYTPLPESGDNWFWAQLRPGRPQSLLLPLFDLGDGPAEVTLSVWGAEGSSAVAFDHHLRLTVNGQVVLDEQWDDKGWQTFQGQIPAGLLVDGENSVEISLPGVEGAPGESVFVESLALAYPRRFVAAGGRLDFDSSGGLAKIVALSPNSLGLDVTDPTSWSLLASNESNQFVTEPGHSYMAIDRGALPTPLALEPVLNDPVLRNRPTGAEYILIGPSDLLAAAAPLLDLRRSQGLTSLAVPLQRVYDDFNFGLAEPEAVRAFLAYAVQNWSPAPRYVLLLGDATYDPKGYTTDPTANRLPSFWVYTVFGGQTVTDVDFARLDADPLPDVALGRLPARTPAEVTAVVNKIIAYETGDGADAWRQQVLAVADSSEPSFRQDAQNFLDLVPSAYTSALFSPAAGQTDVGTETVNRVQAGDFAVAYFGHGSVTQWGKDQLLTVDNSASLGNGDRLPILLNFTCLTGLFTHPTVQSLTESLLWQTDGGAIASLASTSLTLADNQSALITAMTGHLFAPPVDGAPLRLGDAFLAAQRQLPTDSVNSLDVLNTFLLFGDPALVVSR